MDSNHRTGQACLNERYRPFVRDRLSGIAQVFHMIDANAGDQRQVGIHQIDGIKPTARLPALPHRARPAGTTRKRPACRLQSTSGKFYHDRLDRGKGPHNCSPRRFNARDLHPLVVTQQMRGVIHPHFQALRLQTLQTHRLSLAVRARDRHHPRRWLDQPHTVRHFSRALQAHVDGRWMQLLKVSGYWPRVRREKSSEPAVQRWLQQEARRTPASASPSFVPAGCPGAGAALDAKRSGR